MARKHQIIKEPAVSEVLDLDGIEPIETSTNTDTEHTDITAGPHEPVEVDDTESNRSVEVNGWTDQDESPDTSLDAGATRPPPDGFSDIDTLPGIVVLGEDGALNNVIHTEEEVVPAEIEELPASEEGSLSEDSETITALDEKLAETEAKLNAAEEKITEITAMLMRKAADLENTKRRLQKQISDIKLYGKGEVLQEFLPVLDDLERAVEHAGVSANAEGEKNAILTNLMEGIQLVLKKFAGTFTRFGVSSFESQGLIFDPQLHDAIAQVESEDILPGHVASEYLKGYNLNGRLMRPALVVVAKKPPQIEESPAPNSGKAGAAPAEADLDEVALEDVALEDVALEKEDDEELLELGEDYAADPTTSQDGGAFFLEEPIETTSVADSETVAQTDDQQSEQKEPEST